MGFFGTKSNKKDVIDLTPRYRRQQERTEELKQEMAAKTTPVEEPKTFNPFPAFFGMGASTPAVETKEDDGYVNAGSGLTEDAEERKKKFAKRLMDMSRRIEDLETKNYHLQQRIEVLERKNNSGIGF